MIKDFSKNAKEYSTANSKLKIAIVKSNYYPDLTENLEKACKDYLLANGVKESNISTYTVPGSWEIPLTVKKAASSKKFDGIITFGIILKGETYHFEMIANECARALMDISLEFNIPVTLEVLAVYNLKQAEKRSMGKYNRGIEAARTLLETIKVLSKL
ncbi:6,7-dimethyl-8-ribityllumazine synthase [Candidatus Daviesbacteria bacterium]|nr:6,7-dimethyl-8-ribityllumazine synthase [Candidatus Daviesbacteria bacterium]